MKSLTFSILVLFSISLGATPHYASPAGSPGNNGTIGSPWDLQTALNAIGIVSPGDTIYLRAGTYTHVPQGTNCATCDEPGWCFICPLTGTATSPIIIRSYPGEWAKLDGLRYVHYAANGRPTLKVTGAYVWVMDMEILSSSTEARTSGDDSSFPGSINRSDGLYLFGKGDKAINLIVHNVTAGISSFGTQAYGQEFYGNTIWDIGWQGTPNGHGHGFYIQSPTSAGGLTKNMVRNVVAGAYDKDNQSYGSGTAEISHMRIYENIFIGGQGKHGGFLIATRNGAIADRLQDDEAYSNYGYGSDITLYLQPDPIAYHSLKFYNNYFVAAKLQVSSWKNLTLTNNTIIDLADITFGNVSILTNPGQGIIPWNMNRNFYTFSSPGYAGFNWDGVANYALAGWRTATGYDLNSTVVGSLPTGTNLVSVQSNAYNSSRAQAVVFNWRGDNFVALDIAALGWGTGANVVVHNAQDYFADAVNTTTTTTNTLVVDMRAVSHTVSIPYGATVALVPKWFPAFGAFILERTGVAPVPPPTFTALVNSVNPNSLVSITVSPSDNAGLANGTTSFTRTYNTNVVTSMTAPASASGNAFTNWTRNGTLYSTAMAITYTNNANTTFAAVFATPPPVSTNYTVTISSVNPNSGVNIISSPVDNGGLGTGTTGFLRTNVQNRVTTLTAPATAIGNTFTRWERNGVTYSTSASITFTNVSNVSFAASYTTPPPPPPPPVLTAVSVVNSFNPNSGVTITVSPADAGGLANGTTSFSRTNATNVVTTLTAPANAGANTFSKWQLNGVDYSVAVGITFTNTAPATLTVFYTTPTHVVTVNSSNPGSGAVIDMSPAANDGSSSGTTSFTRNYNEGIVVTLTSPIALPGGNTFTKWQLNGVDYSTNIVASVTNNAALTMTAFYTSQVVVSGSGSPRGTSARRRLASR